jgi:hypothetical protein
MRAVLIGEKGQEKEYVNLDAVLSFTVDFRLPNTVTLRFPQDYAVKVFEPYAQFIIALLAPPAFPVVSGPKCWAKQDINGHESLCTLPKGHPGPCRYESPGASPALPLRPR